MSGPPSGTPSRNAIRGLQLANKYADDLDELRRAAGQFLSAFERWERSEDVSPLAFDRLREKALGLRQELDRLESR